MSDARRFEALILPCLDAAFGLARWLLHDDAAAEDAVQEAAIRALRYFDALRGDDARPWFLGIVRRTCFTQLEQRKLWREQPGFDDESLAALQAEAGFAASDPAELAHATGERARVDQALRRLAPPWREVIVLRELQELEYAAIAQIVGVPVGTVMSRLARARAALKQLLAASGARP